MLVAGALAVVASFVALGALWRTSRLRADAGVPLPLGLQRVVDSPLLRGLLRAVVLAATLFVVAVALVGPRESSFNLAPYAFYVTFWVGLVPAEPAAGAGLAGRQPAAHAVRRARAAQPGQRPARGSAVRLGLWPAAVVLLAFAWLELVFPDRAVPQTLGVVLAVHGVLQLVAALWFGPDWFARGDPFEVWSTLLGRLAVVGRRADGRLVLRNPLDGADGTPAQPGLAAFVTVLVGSTAFDGVTRATWYQSRYAVDGADAVTPTLGLLLVVGLVAGLYARATTVAGRLTGTPRAPGAYAHSVVPIAAGYAVAHYFSLLLLEGQLTWILASNPFARDGVDLFGTCRNEVDLTAVVARARSPACRSPPSCSATCSAWCWRTTAPSASPVPRAGARRSQYPLLAVMVGLTVGGLGLLLG